MAGRCYRQQAICRVRGGGIGKTQPRRENRCRTEKDQDRAAAERHGVEQYAAPHGLPVGPLSRCPERHIECSGNAIWRLGLDRDPAGFGWIHRLTLGSAQVWSMSTTRLVSTKNIEGMRS